jgi:hypothetical protein
MVPTLIVWINFGKVAREQYQINSAKYALWKPHRWAFALRPYCSRLSIQTIIISAAGVRTYF